MNLERLRPRDTPKRSAYGDCCPTTDQRPDRRHAPQWSATSGL